MMNFIGLVMENQSFSVIHVFSDENPLTELPVSLQATIEKEEEINIIKIIEIDV